jgi:hypothetical protein
VNAFWLGSTCMILCIALGSPASAAPNIRHDLEVLRQYSEASLLLCSVKNKTEFLRSQLGDGDSGGLEAISWQCAKMQEAKINSYLSQVKEDLAANQKAMSLLKDWYAAWLATIENLPADGREVDTTVLDDKMNKVELEATW